jgi:hypothetical protein
MLAMNPIQDQTARQTTKKNKVRKVSPQEYSMKNYVNKEVRKPSTH